MPARFARGLAEWMINGCRSVNLDTADGADVNLTVPAPRTVTQFHFIAVHSFDDNVTLARVNLPSPLLVPPSLLAGLLARGTVA